MYDEDERMEEMFRKKVGMRLPFIDHPRGSGARRKVLVK